MEPWQYFSNKKDCLVAAVLVLVPFSLFCPVCDRLDLVFKFPFWVPTFISFSFGVRHCTVVKIARKFLFVDEPAARTIVVFLMGISKGTACLLAGTISLTIWPVSNSQTIISFITVVARPSFNIIHRSTYIIDRRIPAGVGPPPIFASM